MSERGFDRGFGHGYAAGRETALREQEVLYDCGYHAGFADAVRLARPFLDQAPGELPPPLAPPPDGPHARWDRLTCPWHGLARKLFYSVARRHRGMRSRTSLVSTWSEELEKIHAEVNPPAGEPRTFRWSDMAAMLDWIAADDYWRDVVREPRDLQRHLPHILRDMREKPLPDSASHTVAPAPGQV